MTPRNSDTRSKLEHKEDYVLKERLQITTNPKQIVFENAYNFSSKHLSILLSNKYFPFPI